MNAFLITRVALPAITTLATALLLGGCNGEPRERAAAEPTRAAGTPYTLRDTMIATTFRAAGVAEAVRQATLSTKLMGRVTEVLVREGDAVRVGQALVRIDARELEAKAAHVAAAMSEASAVRDEAAIHAKRIRALYADSAAARAHLDAAETALARADAGLAGARALAAELDAVSAYSVIRAPFAGVVTARLVDPGAFAAPGAPLVVVQDASRLRITAAVTPDIAQRLHRDDPLDATIEGRAASAEVEGIVPSASGNLYTVNALVDNYGRGFLPGSAATLSIVLGSRPALVVPVRAIARQGDLTGVTLRTSEGDELRWVRLGSSTVDIVEVTAGLHAGDQIVIPPARSTRAEGTE